MMALDLKIKANQKNFPAKLWYLTNNPQNSSVFWSESGDFLTVDQKLFEMDLLSPLKPFKTSNFSSFIRQLNLYGFRKVFHGPAKDRPRNLHHFHNPHFRRDQPELLVHLKRLTLQNKDKMEEGDEASCSEDQKRVQKRRHFNFRQAHATGRTHRFHRSGNGSHQLSEYERSPTPGLSWIVPGFPLSVVHPDLYGVPHTAQSSPAIFFPQNTRYFPYQMPYLYPAGYYSPVVCQCCSAGFMEADRAVSDPTSLPYSHYAYYPQNYSVAPNSIQSCPTYSPYESQRGDVNLERVFQMVDDFQGLPRVHIVQVGTPVNSPQKSRTLTSITRQSDEQGEDSASTSQKANADQEVTDENIRN